VRVLRFARGERVLEERVRGAAQNQDRSTPISGSDQDGAWVSLDSSSPSVGTQTENYSGPFSGRFTRVSSIRPIALVSTALEVRSEHNLSKPTGFVTDQFHAK
jgi:hypothetical protein